jgi:4-deoxy-L-threo-5-hexosulose-uronate ketol-isomerase
MPDHRGSRRNEPPSFPDTYPMIAMHYLPGPDAVRRMSTEELRERFLVQGLFQPGAATLRAIDLDRAVVGGVVPLDTPIPLEAPAAMAAEYFAERREIGVLNIGGAGRVVVDGETYRMERRDGLYIGRGSRDIRFESDTLAEPARYYLVSYPAHAAHPTAHLAAARADAAELGDTATANRRRLSKYFHPGGVKTAQLVMGITEIEPGSVWNTMPAHTHARRTEVYLYFDVPADAAVFHFMGDPRETRHLLVHDAEAVLSPGWSIHAGCGTTSYTFCWAMGGENQDFADMQGVAIGDLR